MTMSDLDTMFDEALAAEEGEGDEQDTGADNQDSEPADNIEDQDEDGSTTDSDEDKDEDEFPEETDDSEDEDEDGSDESDEAWEWIEFQDKLVPVKIDGAETPVPLKELRDGYMRQSDYTRKTQHISEVEKQAQAWQDFQRAAQSDPVGVLEDMVRAFGLDKQTQKQPEKPGYNLEDLDEEVRPFAQAAIQANEQLAQMQQMLVQQQTQAQNDKEQERLVQEVKAELDQLKDQYGEDVFDPRETLTLAAQYNLPLAKAAEFSTAQKVANQTQRESKVTDRAAKAAQDKAEKDRAKKKKVASSKSKSFKASDIPVDDFNDIGELFEQIAAGDS